MGFFSNLFHKKEEPAAPAAKPAAPAGDKIVCAPLEGEIRIRSGLLQRSAGQGLCHRAFQGRSGRAF